jgi:hypothetical protein
MLRIIELIFIFFNHSYQLDIKITNNNKKTIKFIKLNKYIEKKSLRKTFLYINLFIHAQIKRNFFCLHVINSHEIPIIHYYLKK